SGMMTSETIKSGHSFARDANASSPFAASVTPKPASVSSRSATLRTAILSSATNTFGMPDPFSLCHRRARRADPVGPTQHLKRDNGNFSSLVDKAAQRFQVLTNNGLHGSDVNRVQ